MGSTYGKPRRRTALADDDPRHGSVAGAVAGCGCLPCRLARSNYRVRRARLAGYGRWQPFVDPEPARKHLRWLSSEYGIGWQTAAALAGLSESTVSGLLYPRGDRQPVRRCRQATLDAILAVQPTLDTLPDRVLVPAVATLRMLRALVATGHPMVWLGQQLPGHPEHTRRSIRDGIGHVTAATARAVRDLYDRLWDEPPADTWVTRRARRMAEERGWPPPGAWDDDTIDDPAAIPNVGDHEGDEAIDGVLVAQVLAERAPYESLNRAERVELWRAWLRRQQQEWAPERVPRKEFADRYGITVAQVDTLRNAAEGLTARGNPPKTHQAALAA